MGSRRRPTRSLAIPLLIAIAPALLTCSSSSPPPRIHQETIDEARLAAQSVLQGADAVSISVALVDGDQLVWAEGFGSVDGVTSDTPTADTMYGIGSVSKMFATTAIMRLVDQGKLTLDTAVVDVLPSFSMLSPEYRQVTVRMLLNHSSGFPGSDGRNMFTFTPYPGYGAQLLETLRHQHLKHVPGLSNIYTNDGFTLVESLVPALTGKSYARYVEEEILQPLGMSHSYVPLAPAPPGSFARAYENGHVAPQEFTNALATGGLYASARDMGRFAAMLMNGGKLGNTRILSEAAVNAMATDQTLGRFNPVQLDLMRCGLGWDTVTEPALHAAGIPAWYKSGGTIFYSTSLLLVPGERLAGFAVVARRLGAGRPGSDVLPIVERMLLRELEARGRIAAMPAAPTAAAPRAAQVSPEAIAAVEGIWVKGDGIRKITAQADGSLDAALWTGSAWKPQVAGLALRDDGWWVTDAVPTAGYAAVTAGARHFLALRFASSTGFYRDTTAFGERLAARPPLSAAWKARVGKSWTVANAGPNDTFWSNGPMSFTLGAIDGLDGLLVVTDKLAGSTALDPSIEDTSARMLVLDRDIDDLVIQARGSEEWARIGSFLYRPVETIRALAPGAPATVTIGSEGYAEWRAIAPAPTPASLSVTTLGAWKVFTPELGPLAEGTGNGTASVPASTRPHYVLLFGAAGDVGTMTVSP